MQIKSGGRVPSIVILFRFHFSRMVMKGSSSSALLVFSILILMVDFSVQESPSQGVGLGNPILDVIPVALPEHSPLHGSKDVLLCERVQVAGLSMLKLRSYASSFRVTVAPSVLIPERLHSKILVCFHRNASLGLCQCGKDEWKAVQKGLWNFFMSPYEDRYLDVKFVGDISGSVTVSVEEDFQRWRLVCLALGFFLLLLAPVVSSWVPFYYGSSMAIGILLVIIFLLFQGMKYLPTGRKSLFYFTIYGSLVGGAGTFLLRQFSMMVNTILVNFGLSEEMHYPVSIFVLVGLILLGAALGYWILRKFVISEDGSVDVGVAQFVKWGMRLIATTFILQSTLHTPLAFGALVCCWAICILITSPRWRSRVHENYSENVSLWGWKSRHAAPYQKSRHATAKYTRPEFLRKPGKTVPHGAPWDSPKSSSAWSDSPVRGVVSRRNAIGTRNQQDYYSTFHRTPSRKKFSKKDWEDFTQESTRQAMADMVSSPEFTDWVVEHADRIRVLPDESSDESIGSGSDSTEETAVLSGNPGGLFKW